MKLFNQDEAKDKLFENAIMQKSNYQIIVKEIYLWIMLSLKFTFDIFYILKSISNKIEQGFMGIIKQILNAKCHFIIVTWLHT